MFERVVLSQLNDHIWMMDDKGTATGYIVVGQERALVIDTMNGYENVRDIVSTVTDKPAILINTHGHFDHIFGNFGFEEALIDAKDIPLAMEHMVTMDFAARFKDKGCRMPPFRAVNDGDILDLGGLTVEIIALPGHTAGSICLLLNEDRILFTGDSINRRLWMQLEESLPLEDAMKGLDRIAFVKDRADRILHGHACEFEDISLYDKLREGMRQLCEQQGSEISDKDEDYEWFGGKALQHEFEDGCVIVYTRSKLKRIDIKPELEAIDSFCGLRCAQCEYQTSGKCGGCVRTKGHPFYLTENESCDIAACCIAKKIRYCADCANIPCAKLTQYPDNPKCDCNMNTDRYELLREEKMNLLKKARQGQRQVTVCGFCCGEDCFLGEWCGWCESDYNCCSFATQMPDGVCPNVRCVHEKGIDGCWQCPELEKCTTGFFSVEDMEAVNLAKAGCRFINRFGQKSFTTLLYRIRTEKNVRYNDFFVDKSDEDKLFADMVDFFAQNRFTLGINN